jgi:hypothetical protein
MPVYGRATCHLFPQLLDLSLWSAFRVWYASTDPQRAAGFAEWCTAGITREYMYRTFGQANPGRVWLVQNDLDRSQNYLAESSAP